MRGLAIAAVLVVSIIVVLLLAPLSAERKAECDRRGGFYDYKSTACWSNGGYEILGWKR